MSFLLVQDIIKMGIKQLTDAGIDDPKGNAEELYCYLKRVDRARFFLEWSESADDRTCEQFFDLIALRCKHVPLQHLTGSQEFMGLKFKVDPEVLIPRMDTEVVALAAELLIKEKKRDTLLDLCCGSGILGISLAKRCGVKVTATDINPAAKALTEINANTHGVKMTVLLGDLYGPIKNKKYHIIVSNPPYIPQAVIPTLMAEVKDYEPMNALDGGCDGLDFYRRIIAEAPEHLKKEGALVLEIGHDQGEAVCRLMEETGCFTEINIATDLAGKDRVVSGKLMGKKKK